MRTTINVMTAKPPSEVAEELEVAEAGVGGMPVTVTVTRATTRGDGVGLEVLPVDMVVGRT
jgi:hypothetical protein